MSSSVISAASETTIRVFVSYAREDRRWLDPNDRFNLVPFLAESLRRQNVVFWFDKELQPGDEFKRYIEAEIDHSQIAVLIVSQSFLNSEFIESREMPRIAARAAQGKMIVMPVLVEPCAWNDYPFLADRQMVPSASPLIDFTESEAKWARVRFQILDGIKAQLKRIRGAPAATAFAEIAAPADGAGESLVRTSQRAAADSTQSVASNSEDAARRKIPVWAWGTGAALLLAALLAGSLLRTHPHPAASPASATPAAQVAASNDSSGTAQPSPTHTAAQRRVSQHPAGQLSTAPTKPSAPPAQAQVSPAAAPSASSSTAPPPPQQAVAPPAQAAPQLAVSSAPKPAQPTLDGTQLAEAMKSIQNDLNGIGRVDFAASFRNTGNGNVFQNTYVEEVSNVAAELAQCRLSWHWRVWKNGATQPMQDKDILIDLRGIQNVYVEPMQQSLTNVAAAEGRSSFVALSTNPAATALVVQHTQGINMLPFTDADRAQSTAAALNRGAGLCRSGGN